MSGLTYYPRLLQCSLGPHCSDPYTNQLESIQRFAARLATKRWFSTPDDDLLRLLKWATLQTRRKKQKVYRCILWGHSIVPHSFFIPRPSTNPRRHHSCPLVTPFARTSTFQSVIPICGTMYLIALFVLRLPFHLSIC